ncbi:MAG: type ISP restriction/modification enzyme, partial [Planctomycetota bacterium]
NTAVLYQNKLEVMRVELHDPQQLADLLNHFYSYAEPEIERFDHAVEEFKTRVPELARGLAGLIEKAHTDNPEFGKAFGSFFALCQSSINPNLSRAAVDEMLVQHLLTERLFRTIFNNPEFTRRNAIAAEVEEVIEALASTAFNRDEFVRQLDPFYRAIEEASRTTSEFTEKQHFINTVYERFFQGYCVKMADTHGIVYTPQPIVDFMCASVAELLDKEFGLPLGSPGVHILDPCTGTGNFIVNLMRRIPKKDLPRMYREQLFANEVMLLPYYIAALNIEHAYYELTGKYEPFEGLCFVDTLEMAEHPQGQFAFMTEANTRRVERQKEAKITVVIGNPPYNAWQQNENDNNKNRKYLVIDRRIKESYAKDSKATNKNALSDMYVKFFRWAVDRLLPRNGIVCFVSNNSFVDQIAFDGMRKRLAEDFTRIYHLDLHGNVRQNPKLSGTTHNVFGIRVGVGITVAVRQIKHRDTLIRYHRVPQDWRREEKCAFLDQKTTIRDVKWRTLEPDDRNRWLVPENGGEFGSFLPLGSKAAKTKRSKASPTVFKLYCGGIKSNRDNVVYGYDRDAVLSRMEAFTEAYNAEVDRYKRGDKSRQIDHFVDYSKVKWDSTLKGHLAALRYGKFEPRRMRRALYRPFVMSNLYFEHLFINSIHLQHHFFPTAATEEENRIIWVKVGTEWPMFVLAARTLVDFLPQGGSQCFPFYVYNEDGTNRRENITDWALAEFRKRCQDNRLSKWDIFYYVYAILHDPGYRERFADNLKRELPRIPLAKPEAFRAFAEAGKKLAALHLDYEKLEPWPLKWLETQGTPLSYRVEKMKLNKEKTVLWVNDSLSLAGIPPEVFEYRLGNRSALEWVIDQYQVSEDQRSGINSDPNRPDDEEYIVRLVGQVVRVSVETVKIVKGLPKDYGG